MPRRKTTIPPTETLTDLETHLAGTLTRVAPPRGFSQRLRERVREARDGRAFLRHDQEDLTRLTVLEQPHRDVTLVALDVELVRDGLPLFGQLAPHDVGHGLGRDRGSRGLGRAMAQIMAEAGADLVLASRKAPDLEAAAKESPAAAQVTRQQALEEMMQAVEKSGLTVEKYNDIYDQTVANPDIQRRVDQLGPMNR